MSWTFWLYAPGIVIFGSAFVAYARRAPWRLRRTRWVAVTILGLDASLFVVLALASLFRVERLPHPAAAGLAVGALTCVHLAGLAHLATILRLTRRSIDREESP